jgi:uncharacterized membrane protein
MALPSDRASRYNGYMHPLHSLLVLTTIAITLPISALAQDGEESSFEALITQRTNVTCTDGTDGCMLLHMEGRSGQFDGHTFTVSMSPLDTLNGVLPSYDEGQRVIVQTQEIDGVQRYFISDIVRRMPLLWLALLFVVSVVAFGGVTAVRSFIGMAMSFVVLFFLMLPGILNGYSPMLVTVSGSIVIMLVTFIVCHGWNHKTIAALGGTFLSLILTGVIASLFSVYASLTGSSSEEMMFLLSDFPGLNARGILLSGIIIGTLGVLDDITIAQSSAVFELRSANAALSARELFIRAQRIGKDHIAAAVNTLVLAYAGATLPLLLLLVGLPAGESLFTMINREMIAIEIVRTLVGSIGLLAAVPLTTFFASLLAASSTSFIASEGAHRHY